MLKTVSIMFLCTHTMASDIVHRYKYVLCLHTHFAESYCIAFTCNHTMTTSNHAYKFVKPPGSLLSSFVQVLTIWVLEKFEIFPDKRTSIHALLNDGSRDGHDNC